MLGELDLKTWAGIVGSVASGVVAWLHGRSGRKVRVKVGDIEAEASSVADVEKLLARAQDIQQRNQPKAIDDP